MSAAFRSRLNPFARAPGFADWLILTAIVAVGATFPLAWMALTSLKTPAETMRTPPVWIPQRPRLTPTRKLRASCRPGGPSLIRRSSRRPRPWAFSSPSLLAGFAFAKYRFRGRDAVFALVVATMFLPPIVTLIPLTSPMPSASS